MTGLIEFAVFFVGTAIVSIGTYHWGHYEGRKNAIPYMMRHLTRKTITELVEGFDDKVDIVCNACGLVAEVTCAACHPVLVEGSLICSVCDAVINQPRSSFYTIDVRGIVCEECSS